MGPSKRTALGSLWLAWMAVALGVHVCHAAPPRVTGAAPTPGTTLSSAPAALTATFDQAINAGDISASTFALVRSGGDGSFGEANDVTITPAIPPSLTSPTLATYNLAGATLPDDVYMVSLTAAGPPGAGYALLCDGNNDFVEMPIIPSYQVDHLTIEAWVYLNSNVSPMVVAGRGDDYNLGVMNGCAWARFESPCGDWVELTDDDLLPLGEWFHLAMTYDRTALKLYVNGLESASTPWTQAISYCWGDWPFFIGRQDTFSPEAGGPRFLDGVVDQVRIWSVAQSPTAIGLNMYRNLTGSEAGLLGLWSLDEAAGQQATDLAAAANHGRLGSSTIPDSGDPTWVVSTAPVGGITNLAGEVLDGEFSGAFPSGNGVAGGNFSYTFSIDTTGPTVTAANYVDLTHVDVVFSEDVDAATAQVPANYTITSSPGVLQAQLDADGYTVHLQTELQEDSTTYTVTVRNVEDLHHNPVTPGVGDTGQWTTPPVPPQVAGATFVDWTHVDVQFSEPVQEIGAENAGNYSVTDGLTVVAATLEAVGTTVRLQTEEQEEHTTYTVTVRNVRDLRDNAIVRGSGDTAQWSTGRRCTLAWLGVGEFDEGGVDPGRAEDLDWFTWKVNYTGRDPQYVRLHLYRGAVELPASPIDMNPGMGAPATGQTFWYRRRLCTGAYTYRFSAHDGWAAASGEPTQETTGPGVGNRPPCLEWVDQQPAQADGVSPPSQSPPGTDLTWQVTYADKEGDPPAFVRLHLALLVEDESGLVEQAVHGSPFEMTTEDTDYTGGAVFTYTRKIWEEGQYAYWFSAREDVPAGLTPEDAYGEPTWRHRRGLRVLNAPPRLSWAPEAGYGDDDPPDGLDPNTGTAPGFFSFRVAYQDPEGVAASYVRLHMLENQAGELVELAGSPYEMSTTADDPSEVATYHVQVYLTDAADYRYYFSASDGDKDAVGEPSWHRIRGPQLDGAAAASMASLACAPAGPGGQVVITLSAPASVTAQVLNLAGRRVKLLVGDRPMPAGANVLSWDGRSASGTPVPSGVYLVRAQARGEGGGLSEALAALRIAR